MSRITNIPLASFFDCALRLHAQVDLSKYCQLVYDARAELLETDYWQSISYRLANLPMPDPAATVKELSTACVAVDVPGYSESATRLVWQTIEDLIPWRKGPFSLLGKKIESEWCSDLKWNRIKDALGSLSNKTVLDVGCNNGYYLCRIAEHSPEFSLGVDPGARFIYQWQLINYFLRLPQTFVEPLGVEHLYVFRGLFDVVLCMGVLYHRRGQYETLELLRNALRSKGRLLLETLIVGDDEPYCLCPPERYAMMRNVWFVPSRGVLLGWLTQVGFSSIEVISDEFVTEAEQRQTEHAPFKSLDHFLDAENRSKTVEGFPAPRRIAVLAIR